MVYYWAVSPSRTWKNYRFFRASDSPVFQRPFSALPNEQGRLDILKIHSRPIATHGEIDFESVVKLSDGFNGADLRNVCTEAGLFAIRSERDFVNQDRVPHKLSFLPTLPENYPISDEHLSRR